jgi:hypothetical protein
MVRLYSFGRGRMGKGVVLIGKLFYDWRGVVLFSKVLLAFWIIRYQGSHHEMEFGKGMLLLQHRSSLEDSN